LYSQWYIRIIQSIIYVYIIVTDSDNVSFLFFVIKAF
jgi:hypothetical protein